MGPCLGAARKPSWWSERLRKNASAEPSTQDAIETVRLGASLLRSRLSIDRVSSFSSNREKNGVSLNPDFAIEIENDIHAVPTAKSRFKRRIDP
jgi:hypothetical protein